MTRKSQEYIDGLIQIIDQAEEAGSVTNGMVAAVLDHLNELYKASVAGFSDVQTEKAERRAADQELAQLMAQLSAIASQAKSKAEANAARLDVILDGEGTTAAIDTFKEVIAFLEGLDTDGTLAGMLDSIRGQIPEQRVLSFGSVLMGEAPMVTAGTATGAGAVTFVAATKCFVFRSGMGPSATCFANWPGADAYGTATYTSGRTPHVGKLYISDTKEVYLWDGSEFASVTSPLSQALDMRLGGLSFRVITSDEDKEMSEAGTHVPDTIYFVREEKKSEQK
ncbi:MAG: hypothetical protein K2H87_01905 [Duncaniella sp.]|nr:hypothetical protein [Duncaniella sp.]